MMKFKEIRRDIKENETPYRYRHTMGVVMTADHLAKIYECDPKKTRYAALLHDCAKHLSGDEKIALCKRYKVSVTETEKKNSSLLHAKCGAILARHKYGVCDPDILHAICVHTTGAVNMNLLDKIIFVADYIEPNRNKSPNLDGIRKIADKDIDLAVYHILKDTMRYLECRTGRPIDPATKKSYDYYKKLIPKNPKKAKK